MARIIAAATPLAGHVAPLRRIAAALAHRGHDVTFITGPQFSGDVQQAGLRFAALPGIAGYPPERQAEVHEGRRDIAPGPAQLNYDFIRVFYEPIPDSTQWCSKSSPRTPATR